jgi:tetratricopeptide (TPR) repeat protein
MLAGVGLIVAVAARTLRLPMLTASPASSAEAWKTSPGMSSEAFVAQGFDLLERRDFSSAMPIFEAFIREHPDQADAYHGLAIAQRETGNPAMAITNHNRAIELAPERADYYWWHGVTYQRLNNHNAAIQTFERGLEAQNTNRLRPGLLHVSLAQEYRAKGNLQKALELNEQAIALDHENQWFYLERGHTYSALGQSAEADADFARSKQIKTRPQREVP